MSALFTPLMLRSVVIRNRIVISPMCQYSAEHGEASAWHLIHLGNLALSGAGMLCIEATAVEADGRITPVCLGLWDQSTEAALKPVLAAIRRYSNIAVAMQLAHAGRKGSCRVPWQGGQSIPVSEGGWLPHAPSALPYKEGETAPLTLDRAALARVLKAFANAATRAARLGMDALEIHSAHGYLLHEFLSPLSNQRRDQYGGSLENRLRFPLEVYDAVRGAFPAGKPVGVKVSATDWVEGGWDLAQTIEYSKQLHTRGADWVTASSGGLSPLQRIPVAPGYQVPFAQAIKQAAGVHTMAVGLITEAHHAEDIITGGKAHLVALARAMLYDPRWPWHAAAQLNASVEAPPQYWRSQPQGLKNLFGDVASGQR